MIKDLMEQKIKFIIIGLIGLAVISFFLFLQALSSKQPLVREREDLKNENAALNSKIIQLENNLRDNTDKIKALTSELDRVSKEKQEIEKKHDLLIRERADLVEKLKSPRQAQLPMAPQTQAPAVPQTADSYWAGVLKTKTDLELQLDNLRRELKSTQITNEESLREKNLLQLEMKNLTRDNEDLRRQFEYNQKLVDSVTQDLVRERNDKIQIQNNLKLLKSENKILTRLLKSLNSRKINLERKAQELEERNSVMERRFSDMEMMLKDRIGQIDELSEQIGSAAGGAKTKTLEKRESVELPAIIVRPQAEEAIEGGIGAREGKILAVNRENNFVVIDLGQNAGINPGDALQVYREANAIATLEVMQVRQDIAACDIKNETTEIAVGDTVR